MGADLVTMGETMGVFVRATMSDGYRLVAAGAESNVACGVAQLGLKVRWASRLGDDELGHFVHDSISSHGVDVSVDWDRDLPTGACVKEISSAGSKMRYYRHGSAACRLDLLDVAGIIEAPRLHLTGITPALSDANRRLVQDIVSSRRHVGGTSLDVNYRPVLWRSAGVAAEVLLPLARACDRVFIGDDEARALVGSDHPQALRDAIIRRPSQCVVLKRGGREASVVSVEEEVSEPAHRVPVVDLTGAGDAFAAGYLAASTWMWPESGRLRLAHYVASRVIGSAADVGPTIEPDDLRALVDSQGSAIPGMMRKAHL